MKKIKLTLDKYVTIDDEGISNDYYNAMTDLIDKIKLL